MNWESSIDIYTLPCIKYIPSGELVYSTGRSAWGSMMTERGVGGVVVEGKLKREGTCV